MAGLVPAISLRIALRCPPKRDARHKAGHDRLPIGLRLARIETVMVQVGAMRIEPGFCTAHVGADSLDQPPESARVIHLDQVRHFMRRQVVQHKGRRQYDNPPLDEHDPQRLDWSRTETRLISTPST